VNRQLMNSAAIKSTYSFTRPSRLRLGTNCSVQFFCHRSRTGTVIRRCLAVERRQ
jgi:hypothetical protein